MKKNRPLKNKLTLKEKLKGKWDNRQELEPQRGSRKKLPKKLPNLLPFLISKAFFGKKNDQWLERSPKQGKPRPQRKGNNKNT
ncbi:MAG: hypothetical protein NUV68_04160 [Caldiserica bacterium]|nr:hypothetical protein [Caldisericota bacterium]